MSSIQLATDLVAEPVTFFQVSINSSNIGAMRFKAPSTLVGFQIQFYGKIVGSPSTLSLLLYSDGGQGTPSLPLTLLETETTASVTSTLGWQAAVNFTSTLQANTYYWIVYECASTSPNDYIVCMNNFIYSQDSVALTTGPPLSSASLSSIRRGTVMQLLNSGGTPVLVIPAYTNTVTQTGIINQTFVAPSTITFSTIWVYSSDRAWDTTVLGIKVVGPGSVTLATGTFSMAYEHGTGTDSWWPIVLNNTVTLQEGDTYTIEETNTGAVVTQTFFEVEAYPQANGFQNQTSYFALQLGQGTLINGNYYFDYGSLHQADDVTSTTFMASRFQTTLATTLTEVDVRVYSVFSSGTLQAQLWTDNGGGINLGKPSAAVVGATTTASVSSTGWINLTFGTPPSLSANTYYWIVLSMPSGGDIEPTRLVNPFQLKCLWWSGSVWEEPPQGPTEIAISIITGNGTYGPSFDVLNSVYSSTTTWYAQSFTAAATTQVSGAAMEIQSAAAAGASGYSDCIVALYSDNSGSPGTRLTYGIIYQNAICEQSLIPCNFVKPVNIALGTRYWLVGYSNNSYGQVGFFERAQRVGYESNGYAGGTEQALVTTNSGSTWAAPIGGRTVYLEFATFSPITLPLPEALGSVLATHGETTYGVVAYGQPSTSSGTLANYISEGFRVNPWEDGSSGYSSTLATTQAQFAAANGTTLGPGYGWGYNTQSYNLGFGQVGSLYPNETEYYLATTKVSSTSSSGQPVLNVSSTSGFNNGDKVIINYNVSGSTESLTIMNVGSSTITFTVNLTHTHNSGELVTGALTPATQGGNNGIVIDAPELITAWLNEYSVINSNVGLSNLVGYTGWPNSDHPVNYGGAAASGGHNLNTYVRFVNSQLLTYLADVTVAGNHISDGSACALWSLLRTTANYSTVSSCKPTQTMATDVNNYHHSQASTQSFENSSFGVYMGSSNAYLEYELFSAIEAVTPAFVRTGMPISLLQNVPAYYNSTLELMSTSTFDSLSGELLMSSGGSITCTPYFNFANPSDNSSNPFTTLSSSASIGNNTINVTQTFYFDVGESIIIGTFSGHQENNVITSITPGVSFGLQNSLSNNHSMGETVSDSLFANATTGTTNYFWTSVVPSLAHFPIVEADTDPSHFSARVTATSWNHFGPLYASMNYVGGFFGMEQNAVNVLLIDHYYGNLLSFGGLSMIAHVSGTDSYEPLAPWNLTDFNVIVGLPNSADPNHTVDLALVESYVTAGGNLIIYTNSGAPSSLTGIGTTATTIPYPHSILSPYAQTDLNTAIPGGIYGYINNYGSGKVITLHAQYYGDGMGVGDTSGANNSADGMSAGLSYLTINAVLWLSGKSTPAVYLPQYVKRTSWATPLNISGEGSNPPIVVSVCGTNSGTKLIWLSNFNTTPSNQSVDLGFSHSYFNTPNGWQAFNQNGSTIIATGTGDVVLNLTVPMQDWMPLYIQPSGSSFAVSGDIGGTLSHVIITHDNVTGNLGTGTSNTVNTATGRIGMSVRGNVQVSENVKGEIGSEVLGEVGAPSFIVEGRIGAEVVASTHIPSLIETVTELTVKTLSTNMKIKLDSYQ